MRLALPPVLLTRFALDPQERFTCHCGWAKQKRRTIGQRAGRMTEGLREAAEESAAAGDSGGSDVTAVVVAFNSAAVLPNCLESLRAEGAEHILVVDNASSDGTAGLARAAGAQVLENGQNQGFGRAASQGVEAADSAFVLLVNPDIQVSSGALDALRAAALRYPDAGLLAPRLLEDDGRVFFQAQSFLSSFLQNPKGVRWLPEGDCCAPFLSGAALLIRKRAWMDVGGFDPEIFLFYEDDDLCRRFSDAGWSLVQVQGAEMRHARGASNPPSAENTFRRRWHLAWSRGYVARKYGLHSGLLSLFLVNLAKWCFALLAGRRERKARYGGSLAGAWAWLTGRRALEREGLE